MNNITSLHEAAKQGNLQAVAHCLRDGADIDGTESGYTPLMMAALHRQFEMVKMLVEKKANIDLAGKLGETPASILLAKSSESPEVINIMEYFLEQGLDPNQVISESFSRHHDGQTHLIHHAASRNYSGILQLLFQHGADPNITDKQNMSALHRAILSFQGTDTKCIQQLAEHGEIDLNRAYFHPVLKIDITPLEHIAYYLTRNYDSSLEHKKQLKTDLIKALEILILNGATIHKAMMEAMVEDWITIFNKSTLNQDKKIALCEEMLTIAAHCLQERGKWRKVDFLGLQLVKHCLSISTEEQKLLFAAKNVLFELQASKRPNFFNQLPAELCNNIFEQLMYSFPSASKKAP